MLRHADEIVNGGRGEVRVGTLLAGSADILPVAVFDVTRRFPELRVAIAEATPDRLYEDLMCGQVDLVVGRVMPLASMPGVKVEPLYDDDVQVVCTPSHARSGHRGGLAELVDDAWILPPRDTSLRQQVDASKPRSSMRSPTAPWPTVTSSPIWVGTGPASLWNTWMVALSCTEHRSPIRMGPLSPLTVAPNQTLKWSPMTTSPSRLIV